MRVEKKWSSPKLWISESLTYSDSTKQRQPKSWEDEIAGHEVDVISHKMSAGGSSGLHISILYRILERE
jgi:hypothetical protein